MRKAFKKLWNDDRGNMLVIAGVAMPMLMGAAGLATDTIQWSLWKRELQRAADSAAIAGVYDRVRADGATTNTSNAVNRDLELNNHTGKGLALLATYPKITFPADSADGTLQDQVNVELAVQKRLSFSGMFMDAAPVIKASATAATVPGGDTYCVIGLHPSASGGITIAGSTHLDLGDCSLIANSTHTVDAVDNNGSGSKVWAKSLAAAGAVQHSKSDRWQVESYDPYSTPAEDPLKELPLPSSCDKTISISDKSKDYPIDRSTAAAGDNGKTVCISGNVTVKGALTLGSGTYVIDSGNLRMTESGASLKCTDCTIILTDKTGSESIGNFDLSGGTLDISAPTAAGHPYRGVALYQDRRAVSDGSKNENHVNGNGEIGVRGAIYTPGRSILYNGGGDMTAVCMLVIGMKVQFSGNSAIKAANDKECVDLGIPQTSGNRPIRLVA